MSERPSLDQRIAEAEKELKNISEEKRERIRLQGSNSFAESMRLSVLRHRRRSEKQIAVANDRSNED